MKLFLFLGRLFLFWLIFFLLQHILFFAINLDSYHGTASGFLESLLVSLRMNLSGIIYITSIPLLVLIASLWGLNEKITNAIIKWETIILIIFCCILCAVDIGIYKAWATKFNSKALGYLAYPKDIFSSLVSKETLFLLLGLSIEAAFFLWLRKKICHTYEKPVMGLPGKIFSSLFIVGFFITGARGGFQKIPLNRNQVFFSEHPLLNYAAMNSFWNLADLLAHPLDPLKNPYPYFDERTAYQYFNELNTTKKDTTVRILKTTRPNIILIFLESWSADAVECLGGEKSVTPGFCRLAKEGMLFTNFYSTGYRTEQGLTAMLSGFPAQPQSSVIYSWGKFDKLPNLFADMNAAGYFTSFYYGGRLQFDNMEAYLRNGGVMQMVGENDFDIKRKTQWGAYDEEIFSLHLNDMAKMKSPFFSMLGTLTTHEWWDADVPAYFNNSGDVITDNYRNTMHYSDSCLYAYIQSAKQQAWYGNTLFVLVADHACRYPELRNNFDLQRHHIPLLLTGGALKDEYCGVTNDRVSTHLDLPATLFAQLGIHSEKYPRSKNIFNPYSPAYAYYAFDNGFGLVTKNKSVIYDNNRQKEILNPQPDSLSLYLEKAGKAFLQCSNSFSAGNTK